MDKRDRADRFRRRLLQAMEDNNLTQSGLARLVGVDRSTVSQLLSGDSVRLPNAHLAAECASALKVSCDWLLGLSERPEYVADVIATPLEMPAAKRALVDDLLNEWHRDADGYKIRHVPARLPDFLKTIDVLRWEYAPFLGRTIDQAIAASADQLDILQSTQSDHEIAIPLFELDSFLTGTGYYDGIALDVRLAQARRLLELHDRFYPGLRIFLFDARRLHSAPITVFGPLLAVVYLGQRYLVFRDVERINAIREHFDGLIREASVSARDFPGYVRRQLPDGVIL